MKFSLLEKIPDNYAVNGIIYDISADRAINNISDDERKNDYFLRTLEKPLTKKENIIYRQQIFRDFIENDGLLDALSLLFSRYDKIRSDWRAMRLSSPESGTASPEALLEHTFSSLKITASFPSTIESFFGNIGKTLGEYNIKSEGLTTLKERCDEMLKSDSLDEIVEIAQQFRYGNVEDFDFEFSVEAGETLRPCLAEITGINQHEKTPAGITKLFKKKEDDGYTDVESKISEQGLDPYSSAVGMLCSAMRQLDSLLTGITNRLYEDFYGISTELTFYEIGLKYISFAEKQGITPVFPEILDAEEDTVEIVNMKELVLLSSGKGKETVANSLNLKKSIDGLLVKGLTDSGKTVYLRAIAACQLFAQCGLPILAESAKISVRYGLFSHFSSAEEKFTGGSAQGRFDQEAGEISKIIDAFRPYSLLLLNETFQSTSYEEGTSSIYGILRYMPKLGAKYIFVTHLTGLFDCMEKENVMLARTSDDPSEKYRIITIKEN